MNDIDVKLREKIRMLDDIDKMVKNDNHNNTRMNYNTNQNFNLNNSKPIERMPSNTFSNDIDYPLQKSCNSTNKKILTSGSTSRLNNFSKPKEDTKLSNFTNINNDKSQQKTNDNFNYYSIYGNDIFSTKEFTEPVGTAKSRLNIKLNERENTHGNIMSSSRTLTNNKPILSNNSRMKSKSPAKRDKSPKQLVNINININNQDGDKNNPVGDRLYKYGFYLKDKLDKKRIKDENVKMRMRTPEISSKAKNIQRDPKKFHERLYPAHKINPNSNNEIYVNDLNLNAPSINLSLNMNVDSKQPVNTSTNFDENTKNYSLGGLYKDEEDLSNRFYRKNPSTNQLHSQFEYRPKLDKNSLKIAENLTPSKKRLLSKKPKILDHNNLSQISNDGRSKTPKKMSTSRTPSKSPKRSLTPTNRIGELYSRGLENMKKREIIHNKKKTNESEEFKNYSYKPKSFTNNSPIVNNKKSNKTPIKGDTKTSNDEESRSNFYDKNMYWKKHVQMRNEKMHQNFENELQKVYTFKPAIQKGISPNDEKFINKNLGQIEDYVNKRRNSLQKQKEDDEFKRKRFVSGENYKGKMTVPKEFNLHTNSRSRSKDGNRSRENTCSRNNSPLNVNIIRDKLKTNDFFENPNFKSENSYDYTNEYQSQLNKNPQFYNKINDPNQFLYNQKNNNTAGSSGDDGMNVFMSAVNNLHQQLVNFKI